MSTEPNIDIENEVAKFFDDSSLESNNNPKLIVVSGGNGAGKTTYIHENYHTGYVIINAEEIYRNIQIFDDFGEKSQKVVNEIGEGIAKKAIAEHRNIVLEMVGHIEGSLEPIIESVTSIGYSVDIQHIQLDPAEAYERHIKAANEDEGYLPTYFSEDYHRAWIVVAAKGLPKV
jgi:DNA mismatch repair ATPase MutS